MGAGCDFYTRVKRGHSWLAAGKSPEAILAAAEAAAEGPVDEMANRSAGKLYFTAPEVLVAGAPAKLFFNRGRSWHLRHNPNVKVGPRASVLLKAQAVLKAPGVGAGVVHGLGPCSLRARGPALKSSCVQS